MWAAAWRAAQSGGGGGGDGGAADAADAGAGWPPAAIAAAAAQLPRELPEPLALLQRACEREHAESCLLLGRLYRRGSAELGLPADVARGEAAERRGLMWQGATERQVERVMSARRAAS